MQNRKHENKKTDNSHLAAKLELRRHFLRKFHADGTPICVFDACQGDGVIWRALRKEFPVASYWGVDLKPKPGRLKIDSLAVLEIGGLTENVIDIDTYGMPWNHWTRILANIKGPTTVFMTLGRRGVTDQSPTTMTEADKRKLGIASLTSLNRLGPLQHLLYRNLFDLLRDTHLSDALKIDINTYAAESRVKSPTKYIGVRIDPTKGAGVDVSEPHQPKHDNTEKERCHV